MNSRRCLRIATRQSPLALWQANHVRDLLLAKWPDLIIELYPMTTSGDAFLKSTLADKGGKGLFVKELEEALLDQRADLAVHSIKDIPATLPEGLCLAAIGERETPFDAFVSPHYIQLNDLPIGAVIGTSSLRRQSQLLAIRPDLTVKPLRGNIQTRLGKLHRGEFDAIILAAAGLRRLNLAHLIQEYLSPEQVLPACGQGALGIEIRANDNALIHYLRPLNDERSARCVQTERHVNALLGGHCHIPLAVYCYPIEANALALTAKIATVDGKTMISAHQEGPTEQALTLAEACVASLMAQGAQTLLARV